MGSHYPNPCCCLHCLRKKTWHCQAVRPGVSLYGPPSWREGTKSGDCQTVKDIRGVVEGGEVLKDGDQLDKLKLKGPAVPSASHRALGARLGPAGKPDTCLLVSSAVCLPGPHSGLMLPRCSFLAESSSGTVGTPVSLKIGTFVGIRDNLEIGQF